MSRFKRKTLPKKRTRKNNKAITVKGGNGKKKIIVKTNSNNGNGKLTALRLRFVDEYLKDLNATQAVIRAGYSKKGAEVQGSYLLSLINIQVAVRKQRLELQASTRIDQEWVLKRLEMLTEFTVTDFYNNDGTMKPLSEIPKEALYAVSGFEQSKKILTLKDKTIIEERIKKFKLPDKLKVLDTIGKHLGMFEKDNQYTVVKENNINVKVDLPESIDRIGDVLGILLGSGLVKRRLVEHSKGKLPAAQEVIDT